MFSTRFWKLIVLSRQLGVRASLMAFLAVAAAFAAAPVETVIPADLVERFGQDAVMPVLDILASSMLAVIAFSLSIMVSAHQQAAGQMTPRSHRLLLQDTTTQTVLATFLGAFVFALVAIILFRAQVYSAGASVVVFALTVGIVVAVVLAILRWVDHLSTLGSVDDTLGQIENKTQAALRLHRRGAALGAHPLPVGQIPLGSVPVLSLTSGYVRFIDFPALAHHADENDIGIYLTLMPGTWIPQDAPLARIVGGDDASLDLVRSAVTLGASRTFDQDARFGLVVLSEIASRALSPGINDSGTAIDVIGRLERLLADTQPPPGKDPPGPEVRLFAPPITEAELLEQAFGMIARDGAGKIEVARCLQHTLGRLALMARPGVAHAAEAMAERALAYSDAALPLEAERTELRRIAEE